jgi:hypothetical protein
VVQQLSQAHSSVARLERSQSAATEWPNRRRMRAYSGSKVYLVKLVSESLMNADERNDLEGWQHCCHI